MTEFPDDAIALVGLAGRFPGAAGPNAFWENTLSGTSLVTRRTDVSGAMLWARGQLDDIASFDPAFFGMSPRDALVLDPQHRILLECAWEALADAAVDGQKPIRRTAVFAAANYSGYRELVGSSGPQVSALEFESGNDKDFVATMIAYRLGLEGPCITVQTACSSSLVAVHLASQALLEYDADQAVVGGASIVLPHCPGWRYEPRGIHSVDGVCRPFDHEADGTVMGDGAGLVVLRRMADAVADGCRIYAVLRGSAVNNDGSRKIGYAAPSVSGQAEVIRTAQARASVAPSEISYIEAHGTGTPLGDQVEFQALREVFGDDAERGARCALGSAKGALGHLDVAAGVVGLIRASLALYHATLPGTVNHRTPHPGLRIAETPFFVPPDPAPWRHVGVRRAGVSSFGVGGTNAHVVIEEAPPAGGLSVHQPATLIGSGYRRRSYWAAEPPALPVAGSSDGDPTAPVEYRKAIWREWAGPASSPDRPGYARVILLTDPDPIGDSLHERLSARHPDVVRVTDVGTPFTRTSERVLVVCAWALSSPGPDRRSYDTLATLVSGQPGALDVVVLTRGVYPVMGEEEGDPFLAALTGLARVVSMEVPAVRVRVLDFDRVDPPAPVDIAREVLDWRDEPLLVGRGRRWWRPAFEPVTPAVRRLDAGETPPGPAVALVIGVGAVGAAAARTIARSGSTVVLAARPGAGLKRAADLARALEPEGARVLVERCDAADPAQIDALLARVVTRFGAIDQVILAAGISGDAAYQRTDALPGWQAEAHFRVKVDGVEALGAACTRYPIRRVVLISSLAGVLGAAGLGPYSAAAAAMDCFALAFDGQPTGWLSIGLDALHHDDPTASARELRMVREGLSPAEAEGALSKLLHSDATGHLLVVRKDFESRWERFVRQPLRRATPGPAPAAHSPRRETDVPQLVLGLWRDCLTDPTLELDDDLVQHGADSLNSIEALASLGERLGLSLPTDLIFQAKTPRLIAEHISQALTGIPTGADRPTVRHWPGDGPTIWCVHPITGSAECFGPLAALLDGYRVMAVVGPPLSEVDDEDSIESQAGRYYEQLVRSGPAPTVLVGWSYGGVLAFEIAQLVSARTGQRPVVMVLDMPAPNVASQRSIDDADDAEILLAIGSNRAREMGRRTRLDVAQLRPEPAGVGTATRHALDRLYAEGVLPSNLTTAMAGRLASGYRRRMRAVERYRPVPYPGHLVLLRALQSEFGDSGILEGVLPAPAGDPAWGWAALAEGGCAWEVLDGHHATLLQPPSVAAVARSVRVAAGTPAES